MVESGPVRAFAWPVLLTLGVCRAAERRSKQITYGSSSLRTSLGGTGNNEVDDQHGGRATAVDESLMITHASYKESQNPRCMGWCQLITGKGTPRTQQTRENCVS